MGDTPQLYNDLFGKPALSGEERSCVTRNGELPDRAFLIKQNADLHEKLSEVHLVNQRLLNERDELRDQIDALKSREKQTQAQRILTLANDVELFHTPDGEPYTTYHANGCRHTDSIRAGTFIDWLLQIYYNDQGRPPSSQALHDAIATLAARARYGGPEVEVHIRIAGGAGIIHIDLCNEHHKVVEIDAEGWRILTASPMKFRRAKGMKELPLPVRGGTLNLLRRHIPIRNDDFTLLLGYLVQALRPCGPYPVLVFVGEQGTGKSTASRMIRALIDPSIVPIRSQPRNEHDLVIAANGGWMLAFDNLSGVRPWLSDALCRISTGGGFGTRRLYTNREEELFYDLRPQLLNGIEDLTTRGDLADRALVLSLDVIPQHERKTEAVLWKAFERDRPLILGALFDAISTALANVGQVQLDELPRMADFATWAVAAEPAMPVPEGTFLDSYAANRADVVETAVASDTVALAVLAMMVDMGFWEGTTSELMETLKPYLPNPQKPPKDYPATVQAMTARLRRVAPALRAVGVERRDFPRTGTRRGFRLEHTRKSTSHTSSSSPSTQTTPNGLISCDEVPEEMRSHDEARRGARHAENGLDGHAVAHYDEHDVHDVVEQKASSKDSGEYFELF